MSNSLEAIREEILKDARAEAEKTIDYTKKRAAKLLEDKEKEAKKILEKRQVDNSEEARKVKERLLTAATLDMSKARLAAKQDSISAAFDQTLLRFEDMEKEAYSKWILDLLVAYSEDGREKVLVGKKDKDLIDKALIRRANKMRKDEGQVGELELSDEEANFDKGFLLLAEHSEINCSLNALIHQVRQKLEPEVAGVLFG